MVIVQKEKKKQIVDYKNDSSIKSIALKNLFFFCRGFPRKASHRASGGEYFPRSNRKSSTHRIGNEMPGICTRATIFASQKQQTKEN